MATHLASLRGLLLHNLSQSSQWRRRGPFVRVLVLHADALGLNFGLDLFPVVAFSTLPRFVNSQLFASCRLGLLIMFLLSLNCLFQSIKVGCLS